MKNSILAFAVAAILLLSFGCAQVPPSPNPQPGSCRTVADCGAGAARCVDGICTQYDEHGCVPDGGYQWCAELGKCIRPWETNCTFHSAQGAGDEFMPGSDRDPHGCILSAGYEWCAAKGKCIREWEEGCVASVPVKTGVRIITENFPPFSFAGKDGVAKGRSTAVVRAILAGMNQTGTMEVLPWHEGYGLALNTSNVALYSAARTLLRDPLFKWVGPIGAFDKSLYASADSTISLSSLDAARSVGSICVVEDDTRQQMLSERGFSNLRLEGSDEDCIRALASGKTDLWFGSADSAPFITFTAGVGEGSIKPVYGVETTEIFIAFSNSTPDSTVQAWQASLDRMKRDGFYDAILGQYAIVAPDSKGAELAQTGGISLASFEAKVDGKMGSIISDLQAAAGAESGRSGNWERISPTLSALAGKHNYTLFWYALPNGTYYSVPGGLAPGNLADRPYLKEVMAGKVSAGTLVASKATGKNSVVAAVPIKSGAQTIGALGSSTCLDGLSSEVAATLALPDYMYFFAVAGNSQIALHSDTSRIMQYPSTFGSKSLADAVGIMASGGNGTLDYELDGRARRAVYGTTQPTGWHFAIAEYLE